MSTVLLSALSASVTAAIAVLCYVFLYREHVLVMQRPLFFRIGLGAVLATIIGAGTLLFGQVSTHYMHAVLALSVAAAVRSVHRGVHPNNESWFYTLFER